MTENFNCIEAVKKKSVSMGYNTLILSSPVTGPTRFTSALFPDIIREMTRAGADYGKCLRESDSYRFFKPPGGLFITGPAGTDATNIVVAVIEQSTLLIPGLSCSFNNQNRR